MCLICVDYKKLGTSDLIKNVMELSETNPQHAEDFFYELSKNDPETLEKIENYLWDSLLKNVNFYRTGD
jgi:hypothetical protein